MFANILSRTTSPTKDQFDTAVQQPQLPRGSPPLSLGIRGRTARPHAPPLEQQQPQLEHKGCELTFSFVAQRLTRLDGQRPWAIQVRPRFAWKQTTKSA